MALRLWKKAILMSIREKKQFIVFTLMYTGLIFWTSFSLEMISNKEFGALASTSFLVAIIMSIFLALLYAWIIVARNRRVWATLKCIGYTNGNINTLILGHILFTTIMGFIILIEVLFHFTAAVAYWVAEYDPNFSVTYLPLISLTSAGVTCGLFLIVQSFGYLLARGKITKVRPIIALKRVGE